MSHARRTTRLSTLQRMEAERLIFERLWTLFADCDPKIMVTPEVSSMIETTKDQIVAGKSLLRSDLTTLMALARIEPDPECNVGRPPFIWVQHAWFFGLVADYVEQNGDGPLPMSVALEAMCDVSDGLVAVVHTNGEEKTLHVLDSGALGVSGTLELAHDGPPLEPSRELRTELRKVYGRWEDSLLGNVA